MCLLILILVLFCAVTSKITFENGIPAAQITVKDVKPFSQVLVQAHFNYIDNDRFQKIHLAVRCMNRHKKQAYVDLMKKYNGVVRTLIKLKAIPNAEAMIHSIIHRNYLRKSRKWQFFRYFIVYALKQDIPQIMQSLQKFHPETVKTAPIVHYLDEKFMSIAAFIQAKMQLQKFIKQHLKDEYKILQTKDIQITTQKILNEQIIEEDIQKQFNKNNIIEETSEQTTQLLQQTKEEYGYYSRYNKRNGNGIKNLNMKVLFELVDKSADIEDILENLEQGKLENESISDFEEEQNEQDRKGDNQNAGGGEQDEEF